ncbi:putative FKBP12-associated protein 1 like protein [Blattamonas nauphoetae]|uniref:FKBP12-associated protein 1 like protein n=1 Tax=Blattamonas nauphoetae TaxID=2049346 RepID=A0ABQ9WTZ7_9EUKA|nr:putative FKBP12-associated protein 1 like protein [Blattamonas nauphoetae]
MGMIFTTHSSQAPPTRSSHPRQHWHRNDTWKPKPKDIPPSQSPPINKPKKYTPFEPRSHSSSTECPICTELILSRHPIWTCAVCYHSFHLSCISQWLNTMIERKRQSTTPGNRLPEGVQSHGMTLFSLTDFLRDTDSPNEASQQTPTLEPEMTIRCPLCNTHSPIRASSSDPTKIASLCFCGKMENPDINYDAPHSCGDICGRKLSKTSDGTVSEFDCPHHCPKTCHSGPCPPCTQLGPPRRCFCGAVEERRRCGADKDGFSCPGICGKILSCGNHTCERTCHSGPCGPCSKREQGYCYCHKTRRDDIPCGSHNNLPHDVEYYIDPVTEQSVPCCFSCGQHCERVLSCNNHLCQNPCHEHKCEKCPGDPSIVKQCGCGRHSLQELTNNPSGNRLSCLDPVPSCGEICDQVIPLCHHRCQRKCHPRITLPPPAPGTDDKSEKSRRLEWSCSVCEEYVAVRCRCGHSLKIIPCRKMEALIREVMQHCFDNSLALPQGILQDNDTKDAQKATFSLAPSCFPVPTATSLVQAFILSHPNLVVDSDEFLEEMNLDRDIKEFKQNLDPRFLTSVFVCTRPCNQKRKCKKHKCTTICCPLPNKDSHECPLPCSKLLSCHRHQCKQHCHAGNCPPCSFVSSSTPYQCPCGACRLPPPIFCNTSIPVCSGECVLARSCGHPIDHSCHVISKDSPDFQALLEQMKREHADDPDFDVSTHLPMCYSLFYELTSPSSCPPCQERVDRMCAGDHVMLKGVVCGCGPVSCGSVCGKTMKCGIHACKRICHGGDCEVVETVDTPTPEVSSSSLLFSLTGQSPVSSPLPQTQTLTQSARLFALYPPSEQNCNLVCSLPLRFCGHPCQSQCHFPHPCLQTEPCTATIVVRCPCGNREETAQCGACITNQLASFRKLECDASCDQIQWNLNQSFAFRLPFTFNQSKLETAVIQQSSKQQKSSFPPFFTSPISLFSSNTYETSTDSFQVFSESALKLTRKNTDFVRSCELVMAIVVAASRPPSKGTHEQDDIPFPSFRHPITPHDLSTLPLSQFSSLGRARSTMETVLSIAGLDNQGWGVGEEPDVVESPELTREKRNLLAEIANQFGLYCSQPVKGKEGSTYTESLTVSFHPFKLPPQPPQQVVQSRNARQGAVSTGPLFASSFTSSASTADYSVPKTKPKIPNILLSQAWEPKRMTAKLSMDLALSDIIPAANEHGILEKTNPEKELSFNVLFTTCFLFIDSKQPKETDFSVAEVNDLLSPMARRFQLFLLSNDNYAMFLALRAGWVRLIDEKSKGTVDPPEPFPTQFTERMTFGIVPSPGEMLDVGLIVIASILLAFFGYIWWMKRKETKKKKDQEARKKAQQQQPQVQKPKKDKPAPEKPTEKYGSIHLGCKDDIGAFAFTNNYLVTACDDKTVRALPKKELLKNGKTIRTGIASDSPSALSVLPGTNKFAVAMNDGKTLQLLRFQEGSSVQCEVGETLRLSQQETHPAEIDFLAYRPGFLLTACKKDRCAKLWTLGGELVQTYSFNQGTLHSFAVSPDGRFATGGCFMSEAKILSIGLAKDKKTPAGITMLESLCGHKTGILAVTFTPDSKSVVTVSKDGTWKIWEVDIDYKKRTPETKKTFQLEPGFLAPIQTEEPKKKKGPVDPYARVEEPQTFMPQFLIEICPEGKKIFFTNGIHIYVHNLADGKLIKRIRSVDYIIDAHWQTEGRIAVCTQRSRSITLYKLSEKSA